MPSKRNNNRWVYAAASPIHGRGLFSRTDIPAGTDLVEYSGPRLSLDQGERLASNGNAFIFAVNRREAIDGSVVWNLGRHANHSCEPNAQSVNLAGNIWLRALRDLKKGEEITYDYGYSFRDQPVACQCLTVKCRKIMNATRD